VIGGAALVAKPDGSILGFTLDMLRGFSSYTIPGALLIGLGLVQLASAIAVMRHARQAPLFVEGAGFALVLWMAFQTALMKPTSVVELVALAGVTCVCALGLVVNWIANRSMEGVLDFTRALAAQSLGSLVDGIAIAVGSRALDAIGNGFILAGNAVLWLGLRRFFHRPTPPAWLFVVVVLAYTAAFALVDALHVMGGDGRVVLTSSCLGVVTGMSASELLRRHDDGRATRRFMGGVLAVLSSMLLARAALWLVVGASGAGAYDKVFHYLISLFVVALVIGAVMLTTQRLQVELARQAAIDPLTGIFNRRAFFEAARTTVARAARAKSPLTVLILDLDHFKRVNDTHGHAGGDAVLRHVSDVMRATLRAQDVVARFGGEEFVALLPDTAEEAGAEVAERLRRAIAAGAANSQVGVVTASIGVSGLDVTANSAPDLERALQRADRALYAAKSAGRDRVQRALGLAAA
jgi:diguanylate cyclase (GGDEF)-like protein